MRGKKKKSVANTMMKIDEPSLVYGVLTGPTVDFELWLYFNLILNT